MDILAKAISAQSFIDETLYFVSFVMLFLSSGITIEN